MVKYIALLFCWIPLAAQDLQFRSVRKLPVQINTDAEEVSPLASPDGKTLYFARVLYSRNTGGKFSGSDIWVSHYDPIKATWSMPTNTREVFNDRAHSAIVGMSNDGDAIYQLNSAASKKIDGIFWSRRDNHSWTKPELIPIPYLDTEEFLGLYVSPDLRVIVISMTNEESRGQDDLYVSLKNEDGEWSKPRNLGPTINTSGFEISPFLSSDKKRLYFASNGHTELGDADIFYSDRLDESWENLSAPVNLGAGVNSQKFDAYFTIRDSLAFFCSNRDSRFADLYLASLQGAVDSTQLQIDRIVGEAETILDDLSETDKPADSIHSTIKPPDIKPPPPVAESQALRGSPLFVQFDNNSATINTSVVSQLNSLITTMKNRESNTVTLIAFTM